MTHMTMLETTPTPEPERLDPRLPEVQRRLAQRTPHGGYVVPDAALVVAIRAFEARRDGEARNRLFEVLVQRARPMFRKMAGGLRAHPEWVEDAIADMTMQLWKEVLDPKETFMVQNFGIYLKRLAVDQFKHTLRNEGRLYRTNEQGQVTGRPDHVPAALIDSLDRAPRADDETNAATDLIADANDALGDREAEIEADRILHFVRDPLDRKIVTLRVFLHLKWDEIATACGMSERTMRTRFEIARAQMAMGLGGRSALPEDETETATSAPVKRAKGRKTRKDGHP
jgi:RNA polymerase sigma factor (sigma-70 family)